MPAIVTAESRAHVRRAIPLVDVREAVKIDDPVERQARFSALFTTLDSSNYTTVSRSQQIAQIDEEWRFRHFAATQLPWLIEHGHATQQPPPAAEGQHLDPFDYTSEKAIIERVRLYLSWRLQATRGNLAVEGDPASAMMTRKSLRTCGKLLLMIVLSKIQENETLATAPHAIERVLRSDPTGKSGLVYQIHCHCNFLISENQLLSTKRSKTDRYGRPEVELLIEALQRQMLYSGANIEMLFGEQLLIQLCYATGLRIGSLCSEDAAATKDHAYLAVKDVSFARHGEAEWTMFLTIHQLKNFNVPADQRAIRPWLKTLARPENVVLEPHAMLLVMLMKRGQLREKGRGGRKISTVDQLLRSDAAELVGVGDEPLFRQIAQDAASSPVAVKQACRRFQRLAHECGLPYGSFHALRHDFAAFMSILFDDDTAKLMLHHDMQHNTLEAHYTGGVSNFDLMALRAGELATDAQREKLAHSLYQDRMVLGFAHRAVASNLGAAASSIETNRKRSTIAKVPKATSAAVRPPAEVEADASASSPAYAALGAQFDAKVRDLEALTGVTIATPRRSFRRQRAKYEAVLNDSPAAARSTLRDASLLYEQMQKLKASLHKIRARNQRRQLTERLAAQSADGGEVLSLQAMREAESAIRDKRERGSEQPALTSTLQLMRTGNHLGRATPLKFLGSDVAAISPEESAAQSAIRHRVETEEETAARDDAGSFMQAAVLDDSSVGSTETRRDARNLRVKYLRLYEGIWDAPARMETIIAFMMEAGFCPFCAECARGSQHVKSSTKIGMFDISSPALRTSVHTHLYSQHGTICIAVRAGQLLHPGVLESSLLLGSRQSPWFAAFPDLETRFCAPLRADDPALDDPAVREVVRRYLSCLPAINEPASAQEATWATSIVGKQALSLPLFAGASVPFRAAQDLLWTFDHVQREGNPAFPATTTNHCLPPIHFVENDGIVSTPATLLALAKKAPVVEWPLDIVTQPLRLC